MKVSNAHVLFLTAAIEGGGAEKHFMRLAPSLLTRAKSRHLICLKQIDRNVRPNGLTIRSLGWKSAKDYPVAIYRLSKIIREESIDLVYSFSRCANLVSYLACQRVSRQVRIVMGINSQPGLAYDQQSSFTGWAWQNIKRWLYPHANLIMCNSLSAYEELTCRFGCRTENIKVVRNPLPLNQIVRQAAVTVSQFQTIPDTSYVLSAGRLCNGKGLSDLLQAYHRIHKDVRESLVVLGDGPLRGKLQNQADRLGLSDRVFFTGWVQDPVPYYARCAAFAMTSYCEGLPNSVLEAMAVGAPVVSTRCTSWINVFANKGACISVPVGDVNDIAGAMQSVLIDSSLRQRLKQKSARVVQDFHVDKVVSERNSLLRSVLEK